MPYIAIRIKYMSLRGIGYRILCTYGVFVTIRGIEYAVYWVTYGVFVTIRGIVYEIVILIRILFTSYTIQCTVYTIKYYYIIVKLHTTL